MGDLQLYLTILLLVIELVAFAWLIIDIQKSKKKQDKIIELEHQILQLEKSIMEAEVNILKEIEEVKHKLHDEG
jgi:predicted subunit of tRNA(5-methylaminomethyl-2-thiouridylate) methyltransferase|tara:strand:+ start:574 stop:795 length:222 start_codon:yes stop_codon:yes gene_type:complete